MELLERVLQIHESDTPAEALRALASDAPVRAAAWLHGSARTGESWPEEFARTVVESGIELPGQAEVRSTAEGSDLLLLPLDADLGTLVVSADAGGFADGAEGWRRVGDAFSKLVKRDANARQAAEAGALRQRAEESEALHVLGLAANRSLDPDEVLDLVSRFTRTLLGAHYVTVSTLEDGEVRTVAAVGLRSRNGLPVDDPLAARVIRRRKAVTLDLDGADREDAYPFHADEGMRTGLGVPLSLYGGTFGALVVGYRRSYQLAPRDTRLALTLAGHAAVAISNAQLHRDLRERSRELEAAYEELRWTTQAKERFFASMSHELRTPLNAILGYQSLLLEGISGSLGDGHRAFVERAQRATQALLLLVNDVLDLSKIEAGKMEVIIRRTVLNDIVRESLHTIQPLANAKGVQVWGLPADAPPVPLHTDADRVRQILLNLLSNAVKFTDRGGVRVSLEMQPDRTGEDGSGWAEVRVTDTGPGIEPANQERIFHEFEQVTGATAEGGTGLGLPISRKLARLLGGDLRVESEMGVGSTFVLRLPLEAPQLAGTGVAHTTATA